MTMMTMMTMTIGKLGESEKDFNIIMEVKNRRRRYAVCWL